MLVSSTPQKSMPGAFLPNHYHFMEVLHSGGTPKTSSEGEKFGSDVLIERFDPNVTFGPPWITFIIIRSSRPRREMAGLDLVERSGFCRECGAWTRSEDLEGLPYPGLWQGVGYLKSRLKAELQTCCDSPTRRKVELARAVFQRSVSSGTSTR